MSSQQLTAFSSYVYFVVCRPFIITFIIYVVIVDIKNILIYTVNVQFFLVCVPVRAVYEKQTALSIGVR